MRIPSGRVIKRRFNDVNSYLETHNRLLRSKHYELLIMVALARIFKIPFYDASVANQTEDIKLTWNGIMNPIQSAGSGLADGVINAGGYNCVIEATRKTGANQWIQEGAQLVRHTQDLISSQRWDINHTYTIFVVQSISRDSYVHLHGNSLNGINVVLIEDNMLADILNAINLLYTINHIEFLDLFGEFMKHLEECPLRNDYILQCKRSVKSWILKILDLETEVVVGIKSYKAMQEIGRINIAQSEIYSEIKKDPYLLQYLNIIDIKLDPDLVRKSLVNQRFAKCIKILPDRLLMPIHKEDFNYRYKLLIKNANEYWK